MNKTLALCLFSFAAFPQLVFATVGGTERIEVLGTDLSDQKIYYLRHYEDQSGRLPTLYYLQLNSKNPSKDFEVKSIYTKLNNRNYETAL